MLGMCALEFNDNYPVSKFPLNFFVLSHQLRSQISIQLPTYSFLFSIMYQSTPKWRKKLSLKVRRWYDDFLTNHRSADHCTKTQGVIWPTCVTMSLSVPVSHKCESHGPCSYFWALLCIVHTRLRILGGISLLFCACLMPRLQDGNAFEIRDP